MQSLYTHRNITIHARTDVEPELAFGGRVASFSLFILARVRWRRRLMWAEPACASSASAELESGKALLWIPTDVKGTSALSSVALRPQPPPFLFSVWTAAPPRPRPHPSLPLSPQSSHSRLFPSLPSSGMDRRRGWNTITLFRRSPTMHLGTRSGLQTPPADGQPSCE